VVWATVPVTRHHLWRQRMRWRRNMIKIRISKHRDQFVLGRYGFANAVLAVQLVIGRMLIPLAVVVGRHRRTRKSRSSPASARSRADRR